MKDGAETMIAEKNTTPNLSVRKAFTLIETMAQQRGPIRLQDIAKMVHCPASTTLRLLTTLMSMGYVVQGEDSRYALSLKFSMLGSQISANTDLHGIVHPYLTELVSRCEESACLAIEQDMGVVYIDVVNGPDSLLRTTQYIGKSAPMHCTGVGKLLLTNYDSEALDRFIAAKGLAAFTSHTICTKEALIEELESIRQQNYALDDEECELGARCIAAPIRDYTGKVIACISVSGPISRLSVKQLDVIRPTIMEIASRISKKLSYES